MTMYFQYQGKHCSSNGNVFCISLGKSFQMERLIVLIAFLGTLACNSNREEVIAEPFDASDSVQPNAAVDSGNVMRSVIRTHEFSDPVKADTFKLLVSGENLMEAVVDFQIISASGKVIYSERFESAFLLASVSDMPVDSVTQISYINERINSFFDNDNFIQPAIAKEMVFDPNYSDRKIWDEVKSTKNPIGFKYLLGKEDGRRIAYLPKSGMVRVYFNCC